jgi:hypothetical protein
MAFRRLDALSPVQLICTRHVLTLPMAGKITLF